MTLSKDHSQGAQEYLAKLLDVTTADLEEQEATPSTELNSAYDAFSGACSLSAGHTLDGAECAEPL